MSHSFKDQVDAPYSSSVEHTTDKAPLKASELVRRQLTTGIFKETRKYLLTQTNGAIAPKIDDVIQTACAKALAHPESFEEGSDFFAWFRRIAMNTFVSEYRTAQVSNRYRTQEEIEREIHQEDRDHRSPEVIIEASEEIEKIIDICRKADIPEDWIQLYIDCQVNELTYKKAAEKYNLALGTVMSRLHRTTNKIKAALQEHSPEIRIHHESIRTRSPEKIAYPEPHDS